MNTSQSIHVKLHTSNGIHRFAIPFSTNFETLFSKISRKVEELSSETTMYWIDEDGDNIALSTAEDLQEALRNDRDYIRITVVSEESDDGEDVEEQEGDELEEQGMDAPSDGDEGEEDRPRPRCRPEDRHRGFHSPPRPRHRHHLGHGPHGPHPFARGPWGRPWGKPWGRHPWGRSSFPPMMFPAPFAMTHAVPFPGGRPPPPPTHGRFPAEMSRHFGRLPGRRAFHWQRMNNRSGCPQRFHKMRKCHGERADLHKKIAKVLARELAKTSTVTIE